MSKITESLPVLAGVVLPFVIVVYEVHHHDAAQIHDHPEAPARELVAPPVAVTSGALVQAVLPIGLELTGRDPGALGG